MSVKVGSFAKSTGAAPASQAVTDVGFTPRALFLWCSGATADATWGDHYISGQGFTAGAASSGAVGGSAQDNVATSNSTERLAAKVLSLCQYGETLLAECDLTSFDADGFTLNWTTNDGNAYIINYAALGGPNFTNAKVLSWVGASAVDVPVAGAGFQPDCVLHLSGRNVTSAPPQTIASSQAAFGVMTSTAQNCISAITVDARASSDRCRSALPDSRATGHMASAASNIFNGAAYKSLDADGFTVTCDTSNATYVYSLCLKGGSYKTGRLECPASTGAQAVVDVGFQPELVILFTDGDTTASPIANCVFNLGAGDGTNVRTAFHSDKGSVNPSDTKHYMDDGLIVAVAAAASTTLTAAATLTSLDAGGFTLNWSAVINGMDVGYFAFSGGAAAVGNPWYAYANQ